MSTRGVRIGMSKFSLLGALLAFVCVVPLGCEAIVGSTSYRSDGGAGGFAGLSQGDAGDQSDQGGAPHTAGAGGKAGTAGNGEEAGASGAGMAGAGDSNGEGGAAGEGCVPVDDGNECTDDLCLHGAPANPAKALGTTCTHGGTKCDGQGACVACLEASDCAGSDGPCQTRTCTQGVCGFDYVAAGTKLTTQVVGDCQQSVCDGKGATTTANDDTDKPIDNKACTQDLCTSGVPSNPKLAQGTACGTNQLCDNDGQCVGCVTASDCTGSDTECKTRTCNAGVCGFSFTANGTPIAAQTAGDCVKATCDGAGNVSNVTDATDVPADDGNACTSEACAGSSPQHPAKSNGTTCSDNNPCTVADTCQSGTCTSGAPLVCAAQDQCHTAGTCNSTTGACSNPQKAADSACNFNGGAVCSATGACVQCNTATQCAGQDTECSTRTCVANSCGANNKAAGTVTSAQTPGDCKKNVCDGNGSITPGVDNTDLPVDGAQCTSDVCTAGVPSNPPVSVNTACNQSGGSLCSAAGSCVQCNTASQCPGQDTACQTRTCTAGMCGVSNTALGTAIATQTPGDCQELQCDGNGGIFSADKSSDVPADDGNQCTDETCTGSPAAPGHPSSSATTPCNQNGGSMCNGAGACL